jgi:NDP-sugar pyrophosphorylase family protein
MQAMIFAAGLGTRLRPLTNDRPKALVEINGKTLLDWNIEKMMKYGINHIVINVHHFSDMIINHLKDKAYPIDILVSNEKDLLLDTGGGLMNARPLFIEDEDILIHNVDVLSDLDFSLLEKQHKENSCLATLYMSKRQTTRHLLFNEKQELCGWENINTKEKKTTREYKEITPYAFNCIQIINQKIFECNNLGKVFSMIDMYLEKSKTQIIRPYFNDDEHWIDVGKIDTLHKAEKIKEIFY